jgi:nucleotide-binding universal stress UspA family protein
VTMPSTSRRCVVAGFDGSPASRAAVSLAVQRAEPDGRVVVVHAFASPDGAYGGPNYQKLLDAALSRAQGLLANIADEVPGLGSLDWDTEVLAGSAAIALRNVADVEHATEIVVGTRGFGRARALLGSVAHDLIHLANCPVTVIPPRALGVTPDAPLVATTNEVA